MNVRPLPVCLMLALSLQLFAQVQPSLDLEKKIVDATPASLPQGPIAKNIRPDLSAYRLKGNVKQLTGYHSDAGQENREIDYDEYYSAAGFRTTTIRFLQGYPFQVTNFGFVDGYRVSTSKYVVYSPAENPFTGNYKNLKSGDKFTPKDPKLQRDERYQSRIKNRYDNLGRNIGGEVFYNNGELEYKVEIRYEGDREDLKTYLPDEDITWHSASITDRLGNVIETQHFNEDGTVSSTEFFTHNKFDSHGNWIQCSVTEEKMVDGKPAGIPVKTIYRMITYYEDKVGGKQVKTKRAR